MFAVLVLFALALSCARETPGRTSKTLIVALPSEPNRLNPLFLSDLTSFIVSGLIFPGLTRLDDDLTIKGDLASSWKIAHGGRQVTFHLRQNVRWHDGTPFTAKDVLFTVEKLLSPDIPSPLKSQFEKILSIDAPDPYTVRIKYSEPYGSLLTSWTMGILPEHHFRHQNVTDPSFDRKPVGTGPYILKEWKGGEKIILKANPAYFGGQPPMETIILTVIPDPSARLFAFRKRIVDLTETAPAQLGSLPTRLSEGQDIQILIAPSMRYGSLAFNLADERFRDSRVRKAISHAIDRAALIEAVFATYGHPSTGPYPPVSPYADDRIRSDRYDIREATDLLAEAGWTKGPSAILQKNGRPFSFTVTINAEQTENLQAAQIIQASLKNVGITVTIRQVEWQTFRHSIITSRDFEAVLISRAYLWDPDIYELWHSSKVGEGDWNITSYRNHHVDLLLEKGRRTINEQERRHIYREVHRRISSDRPVIFLYNADGIFLAPSNLNTPGPSPLGIFHNLYRCSWKS